MRTAILPFLSATAICLAPLTTRANDIEPGKEFYTVIYAPKPIVLDGDLSEWSGVPVLADPKFAICPGCEGVTTCSKFCGTNAYPNYVLFDQKSTRLNSSPCPKSSAVFCLKNNDNAYLWVSVTED